MKKGFTLIELLAVIVILAIIALIATPIVLSIIDESKENANLRSIEYYLDAVELAVANKNLEEPFSPSICNILTDGNLQCGIKILEIKVKGNKPTAGTIIFENGKLENYQNLFIGEKYITKGENGAVASNTASTNKILSSVCVPADASTVTTGNIPQGAYNNGDEYICEVKNGVTYNFFVISKDDNEGIVNLIMDRNITSDGIAVSNSNEGLVPWVSSTDYADRNTYETNNSIADEVDPTVYCSGNNNICVEEGPITALKALNIYLADWTLEERIYDMNIKAYIVEQNNQGVLVNPDPNNFSTQINKDIHAGYNTLEILNYLKDQGQIETEKLKARLMTVEEAQQNGCKVEINTTENGEIKRYNVYPESCPLYLANYLQHKRGYVTGDKVVHIDGLRGYWLLNGGVDCGYIIHDNGSLNSNYASDVAYAGIRPVITLNKAELN